MRHKLSVIVPVFNCEKYLRECIDSILGQSYRDIELVLVDDGSTDSSGIICDAYKMQDDRIVVIHKENEGPVKARLCGAECAEGENLTFVDGDDWIAPDTYEQMIKMMNQCDVVAAGIYRYYGENEIEADIPMLEEGIYNREKIENHIIPYMLWSNKRNSWELDPSLCTKIFKKELLIDFLEKSGELNIHFGDDTSVVFPLVLQAESIIITHHCYYYHRQRKKGVTPAYFQDSKFIPKLYLLYEYLRKIFLQSDYAESLCNQLEHFYMNAVQLKQKSFLDYRETAEDIFPFWDIPQSARVVLYGAGDVGKHYFEQNRKYHFCNIILWADRNYEKLCGENADIVAPECIHTAEFDYLVIAVRSAGLAQEIQKMLIEQNVPPEKIVWNGIIAQRIILDRGFQKND